MMIGMVAYKMPVRHHLFYQLRCGFEIMPHHEKGRWHLMLFQGIENRLCVSVLKSGVKSQIDNFLLTVSDIVGVVLLELLDGRVSGRLGALLPEAKPPVFGAGASACGDNPFV